METFAKLLKEHYVNHIFIKSDFIKEMETLCSELDGLDFECDLREDMYWIVKTVRNENPQSIDIEIEQSPDKKKIRIVSIQYEN